MSTPTRGRTRAILLPCRLGLPIIASILCLADAAVSQTQQLSEPQINIRLLKSGQPTERATAAAKLAEKWQDSLVPVVTATGAYSPSALDAKSTDMQNFQDLVDVLGNIVVNQNGAIKLFRDKANGNRKAIENLIWAAQSDNRALRLNSTYVLANVADNTNLCLVLDQLLDPKLSADGRVNLLQVVQVVASYAYKQNVTSTRSTIQKLQNALANSPGDNKRTSAIASDILARLDRSTNKDQDLIKAGLDINKCSDERK